MPIQPCSVGRKPGYKFGEEGYCYTYTPGNEKARKAAKQKAHLQGAAIAKNSGEELPDEE